MWFIARVLGLYGGLYCTWAIIAGLDGVYGKIKIILVPRGKDGGTIVPAWCMPNSI
jgi:hypothetical protein